MKAVFKLGGKQHICGEGDVILAEKVAHDVGATFTIEVLSIIDGDDTKIGNPMVEGATVAFKVLHHGKAKKVIVQKYKPKENYRIRRGHRQHQSQLQIVKIDAGK